MGGLWSLRIWDLHAAGVERGFARFAELRIDRPPSLRISWETWRRDLRNLARTVVESAKTNSGTADVWAA
jgi:hypothetical protein